MSKLDTNHVVNLDLVKDRVNSVIKFGLADVETSDFYLGLYNNGSRVFDKDYIVTLYIVKPNGTFRNIELEPKEGLKKYYCNLPDTLKNIPGEYVCQAIIFDNLTNEKKISKSKFKYSVDLDLASEMAGIIDEEEQESILTNILNRLLTLENPVEPYATQKHVDECVSTLTEEIDTIKVKDVEQDGRLVNIESKNTEQDGRLNVVETKNNEQDNRLDIIEAKDIEQDNRLVNIETRNTEQDNRLNTIESKDIEQDGRLNILENKVDGIDEKIVDTIEPTLDNHENRLDALENKDIVHESRMTDIESKNVEQDNRLTSIEGINTTQNNRLDALETKDIAHESRIANIESKNTEQDNRLNSLESKDLIHESRMTNIESKNIEQDERLSNIETKNTEQDSRLDVAENRLANIGNDITNTMQPIIDEHTSRLDAIEVKNQEQDDRLLDIEKVNKRQDMNLKCLFAESKNNMIDIIEEGNSIYLQNSTTGYTLIDEIKGNTLVNCNKEPDKELILNGNINTSGDNTVTITEGVDGGLVDVALEGNTLVNVSKTKDSTAITKAYTVENSGNHIALQGDVDGNCRPVVTGNTLVNLFRNISVLEDRGYSYDANTKILSTSPTGTDNTAWPFIATMFDVKQNSKYTLLVECLDDNIVVEVSTNESIMDVVNLLKTGLNICNFTTNGTDFKFKFYDSERTSFKRLKNIMLLEGDYTDKPILDYFEGLQSSFEDNLVTQEMVDSGEEVADNLSKYKVEYKVTGKNKLNLPSAVNEWDGGGIAVTDSNIVTFTPNDKGTQSMTFATVFTDVNFKKGTQLTLSATKISGAEYASGAYAVGLSFKDVNGNEISDIPNTNCPDFTINSPVGTTRTTTMTLTQDVAQIGLYAIAWSVQGASGDTVFKLQLEYGDTATTYEPYKESTKTLYLNSPLLEGDTIEEKNGSIYHVHRSELVAYTEGDETSLITDKTNTLHELETPTYELIEQSNLAIPSYANGHLDFDTAVPVEKVDFLPFSEELTYLYANTQYTVQFTSDRAILADITLGGTSLLAQSIVVGLNRISITTPETLVDNKLVISGVRANISKVVVTDTDREFGYFEGMKSVGECEELEIKSGNKNLINPSKTVKNKSIDLQTGEVIDKSSFCALVDYVPIQPNKSLKYSATKVGTEKHPVNGTIFHFYDINKKHIYSCYLYASGDLPNGVINGKTPSNAYYLRISYEINDSWGTSYESLLTGQLEYGTAATDYIPHAENKKEIPLNEPLRSLPNGVKDRFVKIGGKWFIERNTGSTRLDANKLWVFNANSDLYGFDCEYSLAYLDGLECENLNMRTSSDAMNDIYSLSNNFITLSRNQGYNIKAQKEYIHNECICIKNSRLSTLTQEGFYEWLDDNETYLTYQLATPTYEPIDYNPFEVYSDITHITTNSAIPANITVKNHGFNCLLKPSTTYTVASNLGISIVTTPSTLTEDCLRFMDTDTSDVTTMKDVLILEGDWTTKPHAIPNNFSGIESAFEQEYDAEKGKYKVNVKVANENKTQENNITFYINEPLRGTATAKDRIYVKDDKVVVQRNCGIRAYQDGDFGTYPTDKVNTVYPLAEPTYEEVEYNDTKLFIESFKNSTLSYNSNVPVTSKLYYSYSVPIVDTVAQTANVTDQQDQLIIDMATQVAVMEMMTL